MVDICDGNIQQKIKKLELAIERAINPKGNFGMCGYPTNPIDYLSSLGITELWRFVLSHPDMDHMDGLDALFDAVSVHNFWDTGVTRDAPEFGDNSPYKEDDWKRYEKLRDGETSTNSHKKRAGARFQLANRGQDGTGGGDGLFILAPDDALVAAASAGDDINDGSFVLLYRSAGGRILLPGDAHDATWDYVLEHYESDVKNCSVMIAPHHGRHSDREFEFLDTIRPKLTLFGCAPSEHLAYSAWSGRGLDYITSNQAGNVVLEIVDGAIDVYVENETFARAKGADLSIKNGQGYVGLYRVKESAP
jgi:beta-lactamase superfamily II metal-dependent hydrolase